MAQLRSIETRHRAERRQERAARAALQHTAAANWTAARIEAQAEQTLARWAGYGVAHWRAVMPADDPAIANDNRLRATPQPPEPGPA